MQARAPPRRLGPQQSWLGGPWLGGSVPPSYRPDRSEEVPPDSGTIERGKEKLRQTQGTLRQDGAGAEHSGRTPRGRKCPAVSAGENVTDKRTQTLTGDNSSKETLSSLQTTTTTQIATTKSREDRSGVGQGDRFRGGGRGRTFPPPESGGWRWDSSIRVLKWPRRME